MDILQNILAVFVILFIAYLLSNNRSEISARTVLSALTFQVVFGALTIFSDVGRSIVDLVGKFVWWVVGAANVGIEFMFGDIIKLDGYGFTFALQILPLMIFYSAVLAALNYFGVIQKIFRLVGGLLHKLMGTGHVESMVGASIPIIGFCAAPMMAKSYLPTVSKSSIFAIGTVGIACVSADMLVGYALVGVPIDYLIPGLVMGIPGSFVMAKIVFPETEELEKVLNNKHSDLEIEDEKPSNVIDAISTGALDGLQVALSIGALIIAFIAILTLSNNILGSFGGLFGYPELKIELILGYILIPITWLLGVPSSELISVGGLIGQKIILNEFVAFANLGELVKESVLSERSIVISTLALCGFANIGSVSMLIGVFGEVANSRRQEIVNLGMKILLTATLANFLSAAIGGLFFSLI